MNKTLTHDLTMYGDHESAQEALEKARNAIYATIKEHGVAFYGAIGAMLCEHPKGGHEGDMVTLGACTTAQLKVMANRLSEEARSLVEAYESGRD